MESHYDYVTILVTSATFYPHRRSEFHAPFHTMWPRIDNQNILKPGCKAEIWLFRDRWQKLHFLESKSRLSLHLCMFDDKNRLIFNSKYFYLINLFLHILKLKKMGFICKITDVTFVLQDQKFLITLLVWRVPWINVINRTDRKCEAQTSSTPTNIT